MQTVVAGMLVALCTLMLPSEIQHRDPQAQHSKCEVSEGFARCCAMSERHHLE